MIFLTYFLLVLVGLVVGYKYVLALVGLVKLRPVLPVSTRPPARFAIVIPAHDEETTITDVVECCRSMDYPADRFDVFVIADNCSDRTAEIARAAGACVLERNDPAARGKGYALRWAFDRILPCDFDAVVVLDADCRMERHGLRVFHANLASGARVLQCRYVVDNPDDDVRSYALAVGNFIENDLFYAPKSRLVLAVLLRGTGMVFDRAILQQIPWSAHSITEDLEYSLELIRHGIPIRFLPEVRVFSPFPVTRDQVMVQRRRWAAGTLRDGFAEAFGLMAGGIRGRRLRMFDAGWTVLILSRPLLVVLAALTLLMALATWRLSPTGAGAAAAAIAGVEVAALLCYFALGVYCLGLSARRLRLLTAAPLVLVRLFWASLQGLVGVDGGSWRRTPRRGEVVVEST
jgi:cellulose synthase/poly-beta-1,6-N-acetylglucosamine synthase-like glycosyltransferase